MEVIAKIPRWLGVTNQQFSIIEAISSLQKRGEATTPRAIIEEDSQLRKTTRIQKSNFFSQLKTLRDRGFVQKVGDASYAVDFNTIKTSLDDTQRLVDSEVYELEEIRAKSEEYFKHLEFRKKEPVVKFFEYDDMYKKTAEILKKARVCYLTGIFPRILYAQSPSLMNKPGAQLYSHTLWERCINDNELEVNYLTHFDIEYLFNRLMEAYKNPTTAYEEVCIILNGLEDFIQGNKKLKLYFSPSPYGLDMLIPHNDDMSEFFLMVRDEKNQGVGAVYIDSPELTGRFRNLFEEECKRAIDMRGEKGKAVFGKLNKKLEKVYAKYESKTRASA